MQVLRSLMTWFGWHSNTRSQHSVLCLSSGMCLSHEHRLTGPEDEDYTLMPINRHRQLSNLQNPLFSIMAISSAPIRFNK